MSDNLQFTELDLHDVGLRRVAVGVYATDRNQIFTSSGPWRNYVLF